MINAVYRRLSPAHGWSLVCATESADAAESVAVDTVTYCHEMGFSDVETQVVEFEDFASVTSALEEKEEE